jgi:hypothetical protein
VSTGRAFVVYTGLRIILLLAVGGLLYLTGARGLLLILLSFLVSGALSLVWLDRPRSQMSAGVGKAIGRVNERIDAAAASEDDLQEIDVTDEPADETSALEGESHPEPKSGQQ